ncbi:putative membrane lipoprotein [Vibrio phage 275E43-1]|nr:putative membrane lipoprotein [Vibrio phage 275E43-1]
MAGILRLNEVLMRPVYINCPNSRYHGMLGTVTSCWFDESIGFEVLYSIRLHSMATKESGGKILTTGCVDMAIDEFKILHPEFGG